MAAKAARLHAFRLGTGGTPHHANATRHAAESAAGRRRRALPAITTMWQRPHQSALLSWCPVGASQTMTVTFTSNDGSTLSTFSAYNSLGAYPAGWSSPSALTCGIVGPGSGCVLTLTYAPTKADTGTLSLTCVFVDNAGLPRTPGPCLTLDYAAAAPNNVVASVSPVGEIDAAVGAKQPVSINFTTDDGNAATALSVSLGTLPAGWSSTSSGLSCAVVSTGNGCQLPLVFGPTALVNGALTLNYAYTDSAGASRSGSVNIPYAAAANGSVAASVAPSGEVTAAQAGGSQTEAVNFSTTGGKTATGFGVLTEMSKVPAGWSSKATAFTCGTVSAGNGCQLQLQYAPATLTSGSAQSALPIYRRERQPEFRRREHSLRRHHQ